MVGEDQDVTVHALPSEAEWVEASLKSRGLCNWLVDYGPKSHVYCGRPAPGGLCNEHDMYRT